MAATDTQRKIRIQADEGVALTATWFTQPTGRTANLSVLISPATGVPQHYYRHFAEYLQSQGCEVLTWDWSGIGESAKVPARKLSFRAWGQRDLVAVLDWAARHLSGPLTAVGHSAGGQVLGLARNNHKLPAMLTVAAQHGYWRHWAPAYRPLMLGIWYGAVPLATRLFEQVPGALIGGDGLPAPIAADWGRCCRSPHYFADERGEPLHQGFHDWRGSLRMITVSDDPLYGPPAGVRALGSLYRNAAVEHIELRPHDWQLKRIGHFGFFRRSMPQTAWRQALDWLQAQVQRPLSRAVA